MKTTITILGLLTTLLCAAPALACGRYDRDETQISNAIFDHGPYRGDLRIDDVVVDGDRAWAIVSWDRSGDRVESRYVLARRQDEWHVDGFTYQVPAGTFRRSAAAARR